MSLCFVQAFREVGRRGGGIRERDYLRHSLGHLAGERHPEDLQKGPLATLAKFEPWLGSLRDVALKGDYEPLQDTSLYEALFLSIRHGDFSTFKALFSRINANHPHWPNPLQPAAALAAQRRQLPILEFCLQQGAVFDMYLDRAAQLGALTFSSMLDLLYEFDWRNIRTGGQEAMREQGFEFKHGSSARRWLFERADVSEWDDWVDVSEEYDESQSEDSDEAKGDEMARTSDKSFMLHTRLEEGSSMILVG